MIYDQQALGEYSGFQSVSIILKSNPSLPKYVSISSQEQSVNIFQRQHHLSGEDNICYRRFFAVINHSNKVHMSTNGPQASTPGLELGFLRYFLHFQDRKEWVCSPTLAQSDVMFVIQYNAPESMILD